MKTFSRAIVLLSAAAALVACDKLNLNFDFEFPEIKDDPNKSFFASVVGSIDKEQTWNLAKRDSVVVTTAGACDVRVVAGGSTLLARKTVSGTQTIKFDILSTEKEVTVENLTDDVHIRTIPGGKADFSSDEVQKGVSRNVTPEGWLVACEDVFDCSGEYNDFDFNDVVFSVTYVSGETTATLTYLAAGSPLYNYLYFNGKELAEMHIALGAGETYRNKYDVDVFHMVNTDPNGKRVNPVSVTIEVPEDFSMAGENIGGFRVVRKDTYNGITTRPTIGCVPFMICVPAEWKWSIENTAIWDSYPTFPKWCNNNKSTEWYRNPSPDHLTYYFF